LCAIHLIALLQGMRTLEQQSTNYRLEVEGEGDIYNKALGARLPLN